MVVLRLHRPHWIKDEGEDPSDQCAHGLVEFRVNDLQICSEADGEWTVSAAALFLLRTVDSPHTQDESVSEGNYLIPCCGFNIWPSEGSRYPYSIPGCTSGIDPEIRHRKGLVYVSFMEKTAIVPLLDWSRAVLRFSDQVQSFYDSSAPRDKLKDEYDRRGWELFWREWRSQRAAAQRVVPNGA